MNPKNKNIADIQDTKRAENRFSRCKQFFVRYEGVVFPYKLNESLCLCVKTCKVDWLVNTQEMQGRLVGNC